MMINHIFTITHLVFLHLMGLTAIGIQRDCTVDLVSVKTG